MSVWGKVTKNFTREKDSQMEEENFWDYLPSDIIIVLSSMTNVNLGLLNKKTYDILKNARYFEELKQAIQHRRASMIEKIKGEITESMELKEKTLLEQFVCLIESNLFVSNIPHPPTLYFLNIVLDECHSMWHVYQDQTGGYSGLYDLMFKRVYLWTDEDYLIITKCKAIVTLTMERLKKYTTS